MYKLYTRVTRTDSSKFGPDMQDHNHRHGERNDVHKRGGALEYDCIGDLNVPRIAVGDDARGTRYRRGRAH